MAINKFGVFISILSEGGLVKKKKSASNVVSAWMGNMISRKYLLVGAIFT